ncbi:uncharacterized protein LOC120073562 [Benincasa hispida]|uniref:uncharacterized protein LOC120073562 n=1 Tax=Benincasa hispida TaxID=102211 RepID=UPI001900CC7F|nr:uncharacterized protein LOC120073562 [Benincasa hispida]
MATATLSLLATDKLTGENYASWKNTINMILIIEDLRFVLMEECPLIPPPTAAQNIREAYEHWTQDNEKLRHDTLKYIFNSRMKEGAYVQEHVLNMIVHFNVA